MAIDQNNYPRQALLEAVLRFVEEELSVSEKWQATDLFTL